MILDNTEKITLTNEAGNHAVWRPGETRYFVDGLPYHIPLGCTTQDVIALMNDKLRTGQHVKVTLELAITTQHYNADDAINEVRDSVEEYVQDYKLKKCTTVKDVDIEALDVDTE